MQNAVFGVRSQSRSFAERAFEMPGFGPDPNTIAVMSGTSAPTLALNLYTGFACRHSGACCTAGWHVPVEPDAARRILADRELAATGFITGVLGEQKPPHTGDDAVPGRAPDASAPLPDVATAILVPGADGACPFFRPDAGNLCAVQVRLGHESLPTSCRQFPRVSLLEPDGVRVAFSHFCPTAAWMLFRHDVARLEVVPDAAWLAGGRDYEGFDARHTIPPLLRPGVVTDTRTSQLWERYLIRALDTDGLTPEAALAGVALTADRLRAWRAGDLALADYAERVVTSRESLAGGFTVHPRGPQTPLRTHDNALPVPVPGWTMSGLAAARLFTMAADSVPVGLARPMLPVRLDAADRDWVLPRWSALAPPVRRYLAGRAFGAWSAYLGAGLRSQVAMLAVALAAVRIETVRQAAGASRPLDEPLLHAAIRSADLLLQHLSDLDSLVSRLAAIESLATPAYFDALGLEEAT